MANAYIVPFDFNPADTHEFGALSFSYTVPAGKYAIVTYSICTSATYDWVLNSINSPIIVNGFNSHSGELRLKAGDVLTRSVSAPSGTFTTNASTGYNTTATAELRVNGNAVAFVSAYAFLHAGVIADFAPLTTATTHAHISEYNITT